MSHFALLWKARTIEKYRQRYEDEKINSIVLSNANIPEKTLLKRWKHYRSDMKKHLSRTFSKWYPEGTTVSNFVINFTGMKFPHILLRSAVGFLGGLILTYLCFVFFVFQLSISLFNATVLSSLIGILLTLGLTLSNRMRCLVFLLIPQLFSRVGRFTLTCYALVLILTGPATNTLKNSEVLSESMACSQEQIKLSVRQINESVKKPFNSIKDSLNSMIDKMKNITWKLKVALVKTNRALITFASIIQSNFFWLDTVSKKCNAVLGTPYKRCSKSIESTAKDYHKITKDISWFKTLIELGEAACEFLQPYKEFCVPPDYVETTYLATIKGKLKTFTDRIKSMLFIHIKIQHSYTFIGNTSRTPSQVAAGIVTEIRNRADPIFTWLSWSSCVTSLFLLLIIFRAKHYQHMYETRSRFDNRYITKEFRELDLKRQREGRYTVLPLNRRERAKYVTTTSFRLVASEKVYLNRSAVFMMVTTFKLLIHIVADYSLYWVLMTIRYHGSRQTVLRPGVLETGVHISGEGFVARFLKSLVEILDIPLMSVPLSRSNTCLPNPLPPDFNRYGQIGTLIFLLWLFALFEPYGLRMRHLIMGHYRPERAKDRALWLYNHILRTRGSFMKFARRKLHREYKYSSYLDMTLRRWLLSIFPKWLGYILGLKLKKPKCLLCNITEESDDFTEFIKCSVSFCPGTYCDSCYADIGKMCTICMSPQDYGDISDISLEGGSSNEDSDDDRNNDNDHNEESFTRNEESEKRLDLEPDLGSDTPEIDDLNSIYEINDGDDTLTLLPINTNNNFQATLEVTLDYLNVDSDPVIKNINVIGILDNYIKTDGFTNKTAKVSQITRMGLVTTAVFQCWYSFYEMNVIGDQILVKRVRSLNYKIRCRKKCSKKIKTVLNGNKITQNNDKGEKKDNADPPKSEKGNYKSYDNNAVQTNEDKRDNKKKKCKKKYNPANVDSKSNTIRSNYMKYIFVHLIPCTDFRFNTQKIPESYQSSTSSVKKKKKWKKSNASPKPSEIAKNNPQESRNYRIAAYLAELEWIKNKENKSLENDTSLNIEMEEKTEEIDVVDEHNDSHIKINDVMIPKLKLNFSTDSITEESETIIKETPSYLEKLKQFAKKNNKFAKIALDRYFKRNLTIKSVVSNFNSFDISKSSVEIKNHIMEDYEVQNNLLSNFDIPRTMKYFDSMHKDLDDIENFRDKPDFDSLDNISSSNLSVLQKKKPSKEVYNKISEENVLDKIIKVPDKAKGKESSEETILGWSRLKRVLSGRLPEFGFRGPLSIMKGLYSSLFIASNSERSFSYKSQHRKALAEKGVLVCPSLCTCGCQKDLPTPDTMTRSVQINSKYKSRESSKSRKCKDIQVDEVKSTCTCATQYCVASRDVGTFRNVTMIKERVAESTSEAETLISQTSLETSGSIFTMRSETSKTDTTICSLLTVDYNNNKRPKNRVKVITKANQSTLTDQTKLRDVSTLTDDWWSPIIEKKFTIDARHNNEKVQRRDVRKSKDIRNRGMTDAGRIVKFKSHAQIIPREPVVVPDDILSPSRYLLESQKYYNELFSTKFYSPHVLTMAEFQHHQKSEKVSSKGRNHYRLSRKTKRLENCYSPRRTRRSDVH